MPRPQQQISVIIQPRVQKKEYVAITRRDGLWTGLPSRAWDRAMSQSTWVLAERSSSLWRNLVIKAVKDGLCRFGTKGFGWSAWKPAFTERINKETLYEQDTYTTLTLQLTGSALVLGGQHGNGISSYQVRWPYVPFRAWLPWTGDSDGRTPPDFLCWASEGVACTLLSWPVSQFPLQFLQWLPIGLGMVSSSGFPFHPSFPSSLLSHRVTGCMVISRYRGQKFSIFPAVE